jgi:gamma-glutamylputrescine oxidase
MSLLSIDRGLSRDSYYTATAPQAQQHAPLQGSATADVAIVGGGLAGLSAAIELAERGQRVVLLEAQELGSGASGRNGGQVIHGLACDQSTIEDALGLNESKRVWHMVQEGISLVRERIQRFEIDCEWQDGFLGLATSERKARDLRAWAERMARDYALDLRFIGSAELPEWIDSPRFKAGVHDPLSGHLHPLKYTQGLAAAAARLGVQIHEHSPVISLQDGATVRLRTAQGELQAQQVLLAGNVYLQEFAPRLAPAISARIMPVGTYIVCSEPLDAERLRRLIPSRSAACDTNFVLDYFRPTADQRMLYGGRVSYSTATPRDLLNSMRRQMCLSFPQLSDVKMDYGWGGFVDISMNRAPDFGRLGTARNVYYLQGFSGHGLALTGLAGRVVAEAMCGDAGRFDTFARLKHHPFPGGKLLRMPALVLGMAYYRLKDLL